MAVDTNWILEELKTNPVWQVRVLGKKWVSPFCGEIGATWTDSPEDMVDEVATFLSEECDSFDGGNGKPMSLDQLQQVKLRHEVKHLLRHDPAWRVKDRQDRWIEPYTGGVTGIVMHDDEPLTRKKFQEVFAHLSNLAEFNDGKGETLPLPYLKARKRFLDSEAWHVTGPNGKWVSPFSGKEVDGVPWGPNVEPEESWVAIWKHLQASPAFAGGEGRERPLAELTRNVERGERQNRLADGIVSRFDTSIAWQRFNSAGLWECPFCGAAVGNVKPPNDNATQLRVSSVTIAKHLLYACQPFQELAKDAPVDGLSALLDEAPETPISMPEHAEADAFSVTISHDGPSADADSNAGEAVPVPGDEAQALPVGGTEMRMSLSPDGADAVIRPGVGVTASQAEPVKSERDRAFDEARRKQLRMLPEPPEIEGMECAVVYQPADMVGGDFYDFIQLRGGCLGIVQGDVSGHGLEVWGDMTMAMKTLRIYARQAESAREMLINSNDDLVPDLMAKTFVSAYYSIIDTETFKMKMARAGHNPLILFNPDRKPDPLITYEPKGMVLGMAAGAMFQNTLEEIEIQLYSGDMLVWYTDGITEQMNAAGDEFGVERLCAVVETHGRREAEYLLQMIMKGLDEFKEGNPTDDDITLIAVRII